MKTIHIKKLFLIALAVVSFFAPIQARGELGTLFLLAWQKFKHALTHNVNSPKVVALPVPSPKTPINGALSCFPYKNLLLCAGGAVGIGGGLYIWKVWKLRSDYKSRLILAASPVTPTSINTPNGAPEPAAIQPAQPENQNTHPLATNNTPAFNWYEPNIDQLTRVSAAANATAIVNAERLAQEQARLEVTQEAQRLAKIKAVQKEKEEMQAYLITEQLAQKETERKRLENEPKRLKQEKIDLIQQKRKAFLKQVNNHRLAAKKRSTATINAEEAQRQARTEEQARKKAEQKRLTAERQAQEAERIRLEEARVESQRLALQDSSANTPTVVHTDQQEETQTVQPTSTLVRHQEQRLAREQQQKKNEKTAECCCCLL